MRRSRRSQQLDNDIVVAAHGLVRAAAQWPAHPSNPANSIVAYDFAQLRGAVERSNAYADERRKRAIKANTPARRKS